MTIDQQFNAVNDKLKQLLRNYQQLKKENQQLRDQLKEKENNSGQDQKIIHELQQQVSILKMAGGEMNEKDKKEFEKKINSYIRAIDKCIDQLSQ